MPRLVAWTAPFFGCCWSFSRARSGSSFTSSPGRKVIWCAALVVATPFAGRRQMSSLRQRLRLPETYLTALALLAGGCVADSFLAPRYQVTGHVYVFTVHGYQLLLRPALKRYIACRYVPTCSEY